MAKSGEEEVTGTITKILRDAQFEVELDNNNEVMLVGLAGKMRNRKIWIALGERVSVVADPKWVNSSGRNRGRIVKRLPKKNDKD